MQVTLKCALATIFLALCSVAPVVADPLVDGVFAYSRGEYATALRLLRPLAEQGSARAQNTLGAMYAEGAGVPKDASEAARWYRLAADQGYAIAQDNLAVAYIEGHGLGENDAEAAKWFHKAADQGVVQAQNDLAVLYYNGRGLPQDKAEAVNWWRKAANQGLAEAQFNLGKVPHWTTCKLMCGLVCRPPGATHGR
jgi:TPR repeat protein